MRISIFTARKMWERASSLKSHLWLAGLILIAIPVISSEQQIPRQFVSLAVIFPAVFLLPGWDSSLTRKGILSVTRRGNGTKKVKLIEWLFPSLAGIVLAALSVFAVTTAPPWQFWITVPLVATAFSITLLLTERHFQYGGRTLLCLVWLAQSTSSATGTVCRYTDFLFFTGYPGAVLLSSPEAGSPHPDSYILASLVAAFLAAGIHALLSKNESTV